MKVLLTSGDYGTWELEPVNQRTAQAQEKATGSKSILFQVDYDFPGLAKLAGWNGKVGRERCRHQGTDGTVDCPDCGRTASEFISAAVGYLEKHDGKVFRLSDDNLFC
jgi:hypothetical protein